MERDERARVVRVLGRIPQNEWTAFLDSEDGSPLKKRLDSARGTLRTVGKVAATSTRRPIEETVDFLGHRLLSEEGIGPWVRQKVLEQLPEGKWNRLANLYRDEAPNYSTAFHGNMVQTGSGSEVLAGYWKRGTLWAEEFCKITGIPELFGRRVGRALPADESIRPAEPLPPLHSFQVDVYRTLRQFLLNGRGKAALLSLPTGSGKTRVALEAICDHHAEEPVVRHRNIVLWISLSHELQMQAWECVRQVWQVPPVRNGRPIRRTAPMRIVRAWGGRDDEDIAFGTEFTVLIASIDQLASWVRRKSRLFDTFPRNRLSAVVVDEAHSLITNEYREVFVELGLRKARRWETVSGAAPVIGLSATPWRTDDEQSQSLRRYFHHNLVRPAALGLRPVSELQRRGILSKVRALRLPVPKAPPMTESQKELFKKFNELPPDYLETLGFEHERNAPLLKRLSRIPKNQRTIVFGCSVGHAEVLSMTLDGYFGEDCSASLSADTPHAERAAIVDRFRRGDGIRFLCNYGVLAMGFDAPRTDVVCMARPTMSALRYEQMVGRGLRGPRNGGTNYCTVLDIQDDGLPSGIQSYARVLSEWDGRRF